LELLAAVRTLRSFSNCEARTVVIHTSLGLFGVTVMRLTSEIEGYILSDLEFAQK
jgi:hypothetical protein